MSDRRFDPEDSLASPKCGQDTKARIEADFSELTSLNDEAATFAFDESKATYDLARERFKALDGKAVSFSGVVTTGLGAFTILGDPGKITAHGSLVVVSLGLLGLALAAALLALAPAGITKPDLSPYIWPKTLSNVDNLARVRVAMARDWLRDAVTLEHVSGVKGKRLRIATLFLVAALASLIANYFLKQ